jgi:hypothetical protein
MADNVILPGTGGTIAADEIGGAQYQRVKVTWGADGSANDASAANPLPVDVTSLPTNASGANNIAQLMINNDGSPELLDIVNHKVSIAGFVVDATGLIYDWNHATNLPVNYAAISCASSGNNTIVAAGTGGQKIRVLACSLTASSAVNVKFQSGAGGTDKTGLYYLAANGGFILPYNKLGWFETAADTLLNLNLSSGVAVGGCITYIAVV